MTFQQQKRFILFCVVVPTLILCAFLSQWVYGQECVQHEFSAPYWADPNMVDGIPLPPNADDPNAMWECPAGPWQMKGTCCDPEGDPFKIDLIGGTIPAMVAHQIDDGTWTLTAELTEGKHYFVIEAADLVSARRYTVCVRVGKNEAPILNP